MSKSGPTASGLAPKWSPSTFDAEQGPQVPIFSPFSGKWRKSAIFGGPVGRSEQNPHPGPFKCAGTYSCSRKGSKKRSFSGIFGKNGQKAAHFWLTVAKTAKTDTFDILKGPGWEVRHGFNGQEGDTGAKMVIFRLEILIYSTNFEVLWPEGRI